MRAARFRSAVTSRSTTDTAQKSSSRSATRQGEAQFDFGEATVVIAGERTKATYAVIT